MDDNTENKTDWLNENKSEANLFSLIINTSKWIAILLIIISLLLSLFGWLSTESYNGTSDNFDQNVKNLTL